VGHEIDTNAPNPFITPSATVPEISPFEAAITAPDPFGEKTLGEHEEHGAPSRQDLLLRAAELGPPRLTLENIAFAPTDPILGQKMQPRVAERRARFRKVVKVALGVCVGFCLVGAASSALSSSPSTGSSATASKTAPAVGIVTVEKLETAALGKAPTHHVTTAAVRWAPAPKFGKRR
jgi:hypothetical protein